MANEYSRQSKTMLVMVFFQVEEESNVGARTYLESSRPFALVVKDLSGQSVLTMDRRVNVSCFRGLISPNRLGVDLNNPQRSELLARGVRFCLMRP